MPVLSLKRDQAMHFKARRRAALQAGFRDQSSRFFSVLHEGVLQYSLATYNAGLKERGSPLAFMAMFFNYPDYEVH